MHVSLLQVCHELVHRLIPGMSLMTPNPFFTAELWSLLDLLPYTKRFELYEDVSVSHQNSLTTLQMQLQLEQWMQVTFA